MLHLTSSHAIDPSPRSQAINNGTISVISSDHSPAPPAEKLVEEGDFLRAWGGIAGLQFSLPATWTEASRRNVSLATLAGASRFPAAEPRRFSDPTLALFSSFSRPGCGKGRVPLDKVA